MRRCLFALLLALLLIPTAAQAAVTEDGLWYAEPDEFRETAETVSLLATGETVTLEGITYALGADGTAAVAGYTAAIPAQCTIPASITVGGQSYAVTSIAQSGLYNCSALTSITLPEGLSRLEKNALAGCTKLTTITLPASIAYVDCTAFNDCTALTAVNMACDNDLFWSRDGVLFGPGKIVAGSSTLTNDCLICYPQARPGDSYTVPDGVKLIGAYAFRRVETVKTVTLPASVTEIGYSAFEASSLAAIDLGSVQQINSIAFADCVNLTSVTIPASLTWIGKSVFRGSEAIASFQAAGGNAKFSADGKALYYNAYSNGNKNENNTIIEYKALYAYAPAAPDTSYTVADRTELIGESAFWAAGNLQSVSMPGSVAYIETGAFTQTGLTDVNLPQSVTTLGTYAFQTNQKLKTVTSLGSVQSLPQGLFSHCWKLESVTIPATAASIHSEAFANCRALAEINVAAGNQNFSSVDGVLYTGDITTLVIYPGGNPRTALEIPATVTEVSYGAFTAARNLETLAVAEGNTVYYAVDGVLFERTGTRVAVNTMWDMLTSNERSSFKEFDLGISLHTYPQAKTGTSYTVPAKVMTLAPHAFENQEMLTSIDTGSVQYIRDSAMELSDITDVKLSSELKRLGRLSLYGTRLKAVEIPAGVVYVGNQALDWCHELEYITFLGGAAPVFDSSLFCNNSSALRYIYVPESEGNSVQVAYKAAMGGKVYPGAMIVTGTYKSADTVKEQVAQLGSDSTQKAVNDAATALVRLTTADMAQVSDEEISKVDELFQEKNEVSVNVQKAEEAPDVSVSGLALASGLTEQAAAGETIQAATVALAVTEAAPQTDNDLLGLSFTMTVNGAVTQPASPVVITVPMTEEMTAAGDSLELVHIADNDEEETVDYTVADGKATFRADSFSSYVFRLAEVSGPRIVYTAPEGGATLIVAWYRDGQMIYAEPPRTVEGSNWESILISGQTTCRAFLLDSQGRPVGKVSILGV